MSTGSNGAVLQFKPLDFNVRDIPADAPEGTWTMRIAPGRSKIRYDNEQNPQVIVQIELLETELDDNRGALGTKLPYYMGFPPSGHEREKREKQNIVSLCVATQLDLDVVPTRITSSADLADFVEALENAEPFTGVTTHYEKQTGGVGVNLRFPRPMATPEDEEQEEIKAAPAKKAAAKAPAKGKTARR